MSANGDVAAQDAEMFGEPEETGFAAPALARADSDDDMADLFGDNDDEDRPTKELGSLVH